MINIFEERTPYSRKFEADEINDSNIQGDVDDINLYKNFLV